MTHRPGRARAGITLTEILISILIMGIGMISLATLFPLGLQRIRRANELTRSTLMSDSAAADLQARNLLVKTSFSGTWYSGANGSFDPFLQDPQDPSVPTLGNGLDLTTVTVSAFSGLPVAYDPLWRSVTNTYPLSPVSGGSEARFGFGLPVVRLDPDNNPASAYGLQRITNLPVGNQWGGVAFANTSQIPDVISYFQTFVGSVFASPDDVIYQQEGNTDTSRGQGSPILPYIDPATGQTQNDWSYTWMYTCRQESSNPVRYAGDLVFFHNRPFGLNNDGTATGERVVEAVFAYGRTPNGLTGYSQNDRVILLRWPATQPDPDVRIGGWIADATYERFVATANSRFVVGPRTLLNPPQEPTDAQRCIWYRVVKRSAPEAEGPNTMPPTDATYRRMVIQVDSPVIEKTLTNGSGDPLHLNFALINPYVVNVIPAEVEPR